MDAHISLKVVLLSIVCLNILHLCFSQSSSTPIADSMDSSFDYMYAYDDAAGTGTSCAPCSCLLGTTERLEVDIFCFAEDIPTTGFTRLALDFNLPGYFKYLSIYRNDDTTKIDLPANAFIRFEDESLDKLHFQQVSFGLTDEEAFRRFQLKYLIIDSSTLVYGNRSFWSLITAVQALKHSLIEMHVNDVRVLRPKTHGIAVGLPPITGHTLLTTVEFRRVHIVYLQRHTFKDLPSLQYVSFISCPIFYASYDVFINVPALSMLQMASSNLTTIPLFLYNKNLAGLQTLALTDSLIKDVEEFSFLKTFSTHGIRVLDLRGNRITGVHPMGCATLNSSSARNLESLYLRNNDIHCSCELDPFVLWLQASLTKIDFSGKSQDSNGTKVDEIFGIDLHIQTTGDPQCSHPDDLRGVSLLSLNGSLCQPEPYSSTLLRYNRKLAYVKTSSFQLQRLVILSLATFATFTILLVFTFVCFKSVPRLLLLFKTEYLFDVYISHHTNNMQLVIDRFVPRLEREPSNLKLRLNFDIIPPENHVDEALSKCRVTIFLFDNAFLNSDTCMVELYRACSRISDSNHDDQFKQKGLIIIFLDDIPEHILQEHLKPLRHVITYLHWERKDDHVEGGEDAAFCNDNDQWKQLHDVLRKLGCKPRSVQQLKYNPEDVLVESQDFLFGGQDVIVEGQALELSSTGATSNVIV